MDGSSFQIIHLQVAFFHIHLPVKETGKPLLLQSILDCILRDTLSSLRTLVVPPLQTENIPMAVYGAVACRTSPALSLASPAKSSQMVGERKNLV